jgi:two-component system chemotaxis sensor kinase CheA
MAFDTQKFILRFAQEAKDHVQKLNNGLLILEKNPTDMETINEIFRAAHTTKGASKMLKLTHITDVAHKMEDILDELRGQKITFSKEMSNLLFRGVDAISDMINILASGGEITSDYKELCDKLGNFMETNEPVINTIPPKTDKTEKPQNQGHSTEKKPQAATQNIARQEQNKVIKVSTEKLDELIKLIGEILSSHIRIKERYLDLRKLEKADPYLDKDSLLGQNFKSCLSIFRDDLTLYDLLIDDLKERAINLRMLPLSTVFEQFPRLIRDIAQSSEKEVEFISEGGDTELDKKIIEKIEDSFIHLLRNSVDHGIEMPDERLKNGKPRSGAIRLTASYEGGSVLIELSDDGAGISLQKIKEKALSKNLFDKESLNKMTSAEIINIIFYPGFSTSPIITDISGRGVGMDVVKKCITEDLKGTIEIKTIEGKGSIFYIRLPLTLAITRVLLVSVNNSSFAIPSYYCQELLRVLQGEIIPVADRLAIRLREQFIPVAQLSLILFNKAQALNDNPLILIIKAGDERMGLIIDAIIDEQDMAILPLPTHMRKNKLVSGIIITGNNELINILHAPMLMETAKAAKEAIQPTVVEALKILVVDDSINTREIERDILISYGYNVDLAIDGVNAIEMAKALKYDIIITDVEMPRMDGFTLTQTLRNDNDYKYTPIIIVTSREKEEDKKRGISVGANAYIVKGAFEQNNLIETIRNLTG